MAKHDFVRDEYGNIDIFAYEWGDYHNGPACKRCEDSWCGHCEPEKMDEECPSGQQELFEL
jgi:hypothetical protein